MKIPAMLYGRAGAVRVRARKAVKNLSKTLAFDSFDPGELIDTATVPGALLLSSERHQELGDHFHCYAFSAELAEQCDIVELVNVMAKWMRWSFHELWRFIGVLGEDSSVVLHYVPELRRPYVMASSQYWADLNAEGRRYGPFGNEPGPISEHWSNLSYSLGNLGVSNQDIRPAIAAGPAAFLDWVNNQSKPMSESSQSLHFWHANVGQIRERAKSRGILTRFVKSNARWSSVLPYEQEEADLLACAGDGLAVLWSYDDDRSLQLVFYLDKRPRGGFGFTWRGHNNRGTAGLPTPIINLLVECGVLAADAREELDAIARAVIATEIHGRAVRDRVAAVLGLPAYEWLSSAVCLEQPIEKFREKFPEAEDLLE